MPKGPGMGKDSFSPFGPSDLIPGTMPAVVVADSERVSFPQKQHPAAAGVPVPGIGLTESF